MLNLLAAIVVLLLLNDYNPVLRPVLCSCRSSCNGIPIKYPFGIDDGGGETLFFTTPSGNYKVQSIDYSAKTMNIYDPGMSTCSILQPHHDFIMTDLQAAIIPPSSDTIFVLVNCSVDSPVLNHYKSLCFDNFAGHSCDELYTSSPPPCCFTGYDTVRYMSMNILDCTHYTSVYNTEDGQLKGVDPQDWTYGMKLSYGTPPETGCGRCEKSGGVCGFDVETQGMTCICNMALNATRDCAPGTTQSKAAGGMIQWPMSLFLTTFVTISITFRPLLFT
ncbi:OLC1v1008880C1 [Oldenlandia corymbosa var. corymbosa]|uniref:OLC1v1008880C1 n=1 Tax=Oldenlandia corymbosa var. corymbosa TaxID=529605 RepID=A0AAV1DQX5_OLDCO|nr:OLC1v1008880C1 [Oldenlandia corymbosa var. corymbosa]